MNNYDLLNYFLRKEEQFIFHEIQSNFLKGTDGLNPISHKNLHLISANLILTDDRNISFQVHKLLVNSLITIYVNHKHKEYSDVLKKVFKFEHSHLVEHLDEKQIDNFPELIENLHISFLNSEFSIINGMIKRKKSKHYLREIGAVYTLKQITKEIVENTISKVVDKPENIKSITCLDFASGTGRFYFEAVEILNKKYGISFQDIICKNLFAVDIDDVAISILRCKIISLFPKLNSEIVNALFSNILNRNALIPKITLSQEDNNSLDLLNDFKKIFTCGGFDVVFSNPPYCILKVNKKSNEQKINGYYANLQYKVLNEINFFRTSGIYLYSIEGMLNYYQLSIEMVIRLTKQNGQIGIICPSSLFADLTSGKLRKYLLNSNRVHFIRFYPESARLFDNVTQSTVIFYLQKGSKTSKIGIEISDDKFEINIDTIKDIFPHNFEIPFIDKVGWSILLKISGEKKLKNISYLRNKRGELDLTLFKPFITNENTGWRLVRGNMISDRGVVDKNNEYVEIDNFLSRKSDEFKIYDYQKERLICQQISNIDTQKRLRFAFCSKSDILGNSCNYIVSKRNKSDLKKLYYILNSELLNWRFKITSSNNHINNYELGELPIIDLDSLELSEFSQNEYENEENICKLYGLTEVESKYILNNKKKIEQTLKYEHEAI